MPASQLTEDDRREFAVSIGEDARAEMVDDRSWSIVPICGRVAIGSNRSSAATQTERSTVRIGSTCNIGHAQPKHLETVKSILMTSDAPGKGLFHVHVRKKRACLAVNP